ncbi:MAG: response regulator transcription factor [Candidatus Dojkabacteria bacterium]|nr:MAG: response regulator transcription factor [Candidatus Dojkabacteria bacterium]
MKVLLVEDNVMLSKNIRTYLELDNLTVDTAFDGEEGEKKILEEEYECIILDLNLPKKDGVDVCKSVRERGVKKPIIMLTARTDKDAVLKGLDTGADDYIKKPFDMDELIARINSVVRRSKDSPSPVIKFKDITIDSNKKQVKKGDDVVDLAPKEFALLEFLAVNMDKAMDRSEIIESVWGEFEELMFSQTVDVHVAYIRKKLGKEVIKTVPGGYMVESDAS